VSENCGGAATVGMLDLHWALTGRLQLLDDCEIQLPIVNEISNDIKDLPQELRDAFLTSNLDDLKELWIKLHQLSMKLEDVRLPHYRPGRFCG